MVMSEPELLPGATSGSKGSVLMSVARGTTNTYVDVSGLVGETLI